MYFVTANGSLMEFSTFNEGKKWLDGNGERFVVFESKPSDEVIAIVKRSLKPNSPPSKVEKQQTLDHCPYCGGKEFIGNQKVSNTVIVDAEGNWIRDNRAYDRENPFGPFECSNCGELFDELPIVRKMTEQEILADFVLQTKSMGAGLSTNLAVAIENLKKTEAEKLNKDTLEERVKYVYSVLGEDGLRDILNQVKGKV